MARIALLFLSFSFLGCGVSAGSKANDYRAQADADADTDSIMEPSTGDVSVTPGPSADRDGGASAPKDVASDAGKGLVEQAGEYLTCKPEELNPIVDCVTVKCPSQSGPLALLTCLVGDCGTLVANVSPKCRDCVVAGVAQNAQGLVQSCLDTGKITGDAGLGLPLP